MSTIATSIFWCAIQVTALSAVALLIHSVVRRFRPGMAVVVSAVSMPMILLLTLAIALPIPSFTAEATRHWLGDDVARRTPETQIVDVANANETAGQTLDDAADARRSTAIPGWLQTAYEAIKDEVARPAPQSKAAMTDWRPFAVILIGCVGALGLLRVLWGLATCTSLRKRGKPVESPELLAMVDAITCDLGLRRQVEVLESDLVASPATLGWRHPVILLPAGSWRDWSYEQLQVVLSHELAHIRRGDFALGLIGHLCVAFHFYHPLVHWLAARMRLDQELHADNAAAELNGGPNRYLEILARMVLDHDSRLVGWPAPMFIPTRGTLVRRIEMLKSTTPFSRRGRTAQVMLTVSLVAVALVCAGIRTPLSPLTPDKPATGQERPITTATTAANTSYVASDADTVVVLRPGGFLNHAVLGKVVGVFTEHRRFDLLRNENLAQLTWVYRSSTQPGAGGEFPLAPITTIIEMKEKSDFSEIKSMLEMQSKDAVVGKIVGPPDATALCSYQRDDKTLIVDNRRNLTVYLAAMSNEAPALLKSAHWKAVSSADMAVAIDAKVVAKVMAEAPDTPAKGMVAPALDGGKTMHLGLFAKTTPELLGKFEGQDAATADKITSLLTTVKLLGLSGLENVQKQPAVDGEEFTRVFVDLGIRVLKSAEVSAEDNVVTLNMNAAMDSPEQAAAMAEAVASARRTARSMQSMNNVKQIMLAMHNYHDTYGHFPAAKILGPNGKHYHSWRVAILPYMEQQALYNAYNFDEPWDSANNKKVGANVIQAYVDPESKDNHVNTNYFVVIGEGTGFSAEPSKKGLGLREYRDGSSNTIAVVSAERSIPWSKPEDISFDVLMNSYKDGKVQLGVGGDRFGAGYADGSARRLPLTIDMAELRDLLLINNQR